MSNPQLSCRNLDPIGDLTVSLSGINQALRSIIELIDICETAISYGINTF